MPGSEPGLPDSVIIPSGKIVVVTITATLQLVNLTIEQNSILHLNPSSYRYVLCYIIYYLALIFLYISEFSSKVFGKGKIIAVRTNFNPGFTLSNESVLGTLIHIFFFLSYLIILLKIEFAQSTLTGPLDLEGSVTITTSFNGFKTFLGDLKIASLILGESCSVSSQSNTTIEVSYFEVAGLSSIEKYYFYIGSYY